MRQLLVSVLALSLSGSPAVAQSLHEGSPQPLQDSAHAEVSNFAAAQAAQGGAYMPAGMNPAYFWTSIGLMSLGGVVMVAGYQVNRSNNASAFCAIASSSGSGCEDGKRPMVLGAAMVGGGVLVWILGKNNARAAGNPQLLWSPRGVTVRGGINF